MFNLYINVIRYESDIKLIHSVYIEIYWGGMKLTHTFYGLCQGDLYIKFTLTTVKLNI